METSDATNDSPLAPLARQIAGYVARKYAGDADFRCRVREYVEAEFTWAFLAQPADFLRLAQFAALTVAAELSFYAAMRRHHPQLPNLSLQDRTSFQASLRTGLTQAAGILGQPVSLSLPAEFVLDLTTLPLDVLGRYGEGPSALLPHLSGALWEAQTPQSERRLAGQFYSAVDPIDLILGFCVRSPDDLVLDPSCGSGAFLLRALDRLAALQPSRPPADLAPQLFGVDKDRHALRFALHSLAARCGAAPNLRSADFFSMRPGDLPGLTAIIGNPPYTRQEIMDEATVKRAARLAVQLDWGLVIPGRAGLHIPFLLHAAAFLPLGGRLGMLTPNSWLNADYGLDLRAFLLEQCRLLAVVAPSGERWFDAAVNPLIVIVQRESDAAARLGQPVHFVHLKRPLDAVIGARPKSPDRWAAIHRLVSRIESAQASFEDDGLRVAVVRQAELAGPRPSTNIYRTGDLSAGGPVHQRPLSLPNDSFAQRDGAPGDVSQLASFCVPGAQRRDNPKWSIYLGAHDFHRELMLKAGAFFRPLGELASIRRGLTTGANDFFYVRDLGTPPAKECLGPDLRLIESGDGSHHFLESCYLHPVVTSARDLQALLVDPSGLPKRVVLLPESLAGLEGTRVLEYVQWGAAIKGIAGRRTCAQRRSWWHLVPAEAGALLWCKTHFARHIVPLNPAGAIVDCNLYQLTPMAGVDRILLAAILNSTLVALLKEWHGRANLGHGALKTEVSDLTAMPVPDPRLIGPTHCSNLFAAWQAFYVNAPCNLLGDLTTVRRYLDETLLAALGYDQPYDQRLLLHEVASRTLRDRLSVRAEPPRPHEGTLTFI